MTVHKTVYVVALAGLWFVPRTQAQASGTNYDESKVPEYTLPDPLVMSGGDRVTDAETWWEKRRPGILQLFETQMYGRRPGRPQDMTFEVTSTELQALNGKATRKGCRNSIRRDYAAFA